MKSTTCVRELSKSGGTLVNYNGHDLVVYNSNTSAAQLLIEQAMVTANHVVI